MRLLRAPDSSVSVLVPPLGGLMTFPILLRNSRLRDRRSEDKWCLADAPLSPQHAEPLRWDTCGNLNHLAHKTTEGLNADSAWTARSRLLRCN